MSGENGGKTSWRWRQPIAPHTQPTPLPKADKPCFGFIYNIYIYIFTQEQGLYSNCWVIQGGRLHEQSKRQTDQPTHGGNCWEGMTERVGERGESLHSWGLATTSQSLLSEGRFHEFWGGTGPQPLAAEIKRCSGTVQTTHTQFVSGKLISDRKAVLSVCVHVCVLRGGVIRNSSIDPAIAVPTMNHSLNCAECFTILLHSPSQQPYEVGHYHSIFIFYFFTTEGTEFLKATYARAPRASLPKKKHKAPQFLEQHSYVHWVMSATAAGFTTGLW